MRPHSVNAKKALEQWQNLVDTLKSLNIQVDIIEQQPDVPDMVFATDQGIVQDNEVVLANFRFTERQKERVYYREWFREHGFRLRALSNVFPFEGGDTLFFKDKLLVGTGFRASFESCDELWKKLDVVVVPLELVDPRYYHLDTCLVPIDDSLVFYYPPAFSMESRKKLKSLVPQLKEFSDTEVAGYAANSFVSGDHVVIQSGVPTFAEKLRECGKIVHEVDVSEFNKSGGGIHCLINTLEKE